MLFNSKNKISMTSKNDFVHDHKDTLEMSKFFYDEGNRHHNKENYEMAIMYYNKAIENDKLNKILYSQRALAFLRRGKFSNALRDGLKCIELDDKYNKGYCRASMAYMGMNDLINANRVIQLASVEDQEVIMVKERLERKEDEQNGLRREYKSYDKFLDLTTWLHKGDAYFAKLDIHFYSDDHRGVKSIATIERDEIILRIPKDMLISIEVAKATELGSKISNFMYTELNSPKHCLLTSFVLSEIQKRINSKWKQYLDIIPKDFSNFPIFFTNEELSCLEGSPFLQQIIEKKTDIANDYDKICFFVPEFAKFSFIDFCKIRMAICSRIFGVKIDGKKTDVLAPYADLLNHKRPRQTHWYYDENYQSFIIQALEDIPIGSEIYDSYGKKCNSRFFLNYGFLVEDNDANEFPLTIEMNEKNCFNFAEKKELFKYPQDLIRKFRLNEDLLDFNAIDLFSCLRFMIFKGDLLLLEKLIQNNDNIAIIDGHPNFFLVPPISIQEEINMLRALETEINQHINLYPTTITEDQALLKDKSLSYNTVNCIQMRLCEKTILTFYLNFATYCIPLFDMEENDIIDKLAADFPLACPYEYYIEFVILKFIRRKEEHN